MGAVDPRAAASLPPPGQTIVFDFAGDLADVRDLDFAGIVLAIAAALEHAGRASSRHSSAWSSILCLNMLYRELVSPGLTRERGGSSLKRI